MPDRFDLDRLRARAARFGARPAGRRVQRGARWVFSLGIVALIGLQLRDVGWGALVASLPRTPWFYVLLLAMYALLPAAETLIYRYLWGVRVRSTLPMLLRKRVLNNEVVSYSGEVYLLWWARQRVAGGTRRLLGAVKDNAIVSSSVGLASALLVLGAFAAAGHLPAALLPSTSLRGLAVGALVLTAGTLLALRFRSRLFALPRRALGVLAAIHGARYLSAYGLQVLQWWVVLPFVPFGVWATMLAVYVGAQRLPLIPSRDLVGISVILSLAGTFELSTAVLAGLLLTRSVIDKALNLAVFAATSFLPEPDAAAPVPETLAAEPG